MHSVLRTYSYMYNVRDVRKITPVYILGGPVSVVRLIIVSVCYEFCI